MKENSWVEFFGVPGVGKSTLFNEISKSISGNWITEKEAVIMSKVKLTKTNVFTKTILRFIYKFPYIAKRVSKIHEPINKRDLISAFINESPDFYNYSVKNIFSSSNTDYRKTYAFVIFLETIKKIVLINNARLGFNILSDESLCQRFFTLLSKESRNEEKMVEEYFKKVPIKGCVVYVDLNEKEVVNRILRRYKSTNRLNYMNKCLSKDELLNQAKAYLNYVKIGIRILETRNVNILRVNGAHTIQENHKKILFFLNKGI